MNDPIDQLLTEHREIMAEVRSLRAALEDLRRRGDAALPVALPALRSVARMMGTRLLQHARREDEALFPALEEVFGSTDAPTVVMREEHRAIHGQARLFRDTLRELNEVEHPAIVAGGTVLRQRVERGAGAAELIGTGEEIVQLLDLHFGKEEEILFPMARTILSEQAMERVAAAIAAIDAEAESA